MNELDEVYPKKTFYRVNVGMMTKIEKRKILREMQKEVILENKQRVKKIGNYEAYFHSPEDAKNYLIDYYKTQLRIIKEQYEAEKKRVEKLLKNAEEL